MILPLCATTIRYIQYIDFHERIKAFHVKDAEFLRENKELFGTKVG
jgi:hypothetical protein